jgi:outer membrane protein assembly factor BamB
MMSTCLHARDTRTAHSRRARVVLVAAVAVAGWSSLDDANDARAAAVDELAWRQWGGPRRNFTADSRDLASEWPVGGPRRVWTRPLGEGHSTILVDDRRLFTMYRPLPQRPNDPSRDEETVIALDEEPGRTLSEHRYAAAPLDFQYGAGPHATPLIVGDRIFTAGTNKQIYALDKRTGRVLWHHDLVKEFGRHRR